MKIRIFSDFCTSNVVTDAFIEMYGFNPGWFVLDDSYTHVILINAPMPDISHIPPKNVVGLANEPFLGIVSESDRTPFLRITPSFIDYAKKYVGRYLVGDTKGLPSPFEAHYGYMFHTGISTPIHPLPRSGVSMMVSNKKMLPGHRYRHALVERILRENLPVDVWGRALPELRAQYGDRPQLKGAFGKGPSPLYGKYKYSIAVENIQLDSYISEKFTDCLMTETVPIYLGTTRVDDLFGSGVCIHLTGNLDEDIAIIKRACEDTNPSIPTEIKSARDQLLSSPTACLFTAIESGYLFPR